MTEPHSRNEAQTAQRQHRKKDQWGINILTAHTPEEVFSNPPAAPQVTPRKRGASQATA